MEQEIVILKCRWMSGKPSRIRDTTGLEQTAWSFHLCPWLEMAEPGRMEVPADPSCPGPTEARMLQVPVPVPASSAAGLVSPVGARTHTYTHTYTRLVTQIHCSQREVLAPVPMQTPAALARTWRVQMAPSCSSPPARRGLKLAVMEYIHKNHASLQQLALAAQSIWLLALSPWSPPVAGPWT